MAYSITERARCAAWFEWTKSVVEVQRKFHTEYGKNTAAPSGHSIRRWHERLLTTGNVQDVKRNRPLSSRKDENVQLTIQHFHEEPHTSTHRAANTLNMSRSTIQRILHGLRWHPYKVQVVQALHEEDLENRLESAEITDEMRQKMVLQYCERLKRLIENDGGHVEVHS